MQSRDHTGVERKQRLRGTKCPKQLDEKFLASVNAPPMPYFFTGQDTENIYSISNTPSFPNYLQTPSSRATTGADSFANANHNDSEVPNGEFDFWEKPTSSSEEFVPQILILPTFSNVLVRLGEWVSYLSDIRDMVQEMQESDGQSHDNMNDHYQGVI